MLKSLAIKNYALIEELSIDLSDGFTAITGETGAGKSILLGALSLLLGKRADLNILMDKKKKCIVEGTFDILKLDLIDSFSDYDLDYDTTTIIRREIIPSGKSRAFINDTPVKLEVLKLFGERLVDIHSQHQTLALGKAQFQLQVLDDFINEPKKIKEYQKYFNEFRLLSNELEILSIQNENAKRDQDYYQYQYDELKAADLKEDEYKKLIERESHLTHAEEVSQGIEIAIRILTGEEEAIVDKLKIVKDSLSKISEYHRGFNDIAERLNSSTIELDDIATEISKLEESSEPDPEELTSITERLDIIYRLQQKHHVKSIEELLELQEDYSAKLDGITSNDEKISEIKLSLEVAKLKANKLANEIHELRVAEAPKLAKAVVLLLNQLGMKDAVFRIEVNPLDKFTANGKDQVRFLFNANKGGSAKEISQIASGGELSRLMLAIKSLINRESILPTVIFDEIDSGVSGGIAGKVGNILKDMSVHHQLVAITHLPQIAAKADNHFKVFKSIENGHAVALLSRLDEKSRVEEIATLLSDEIVTASAMDTARELLSLRS